MNRAITKLVSIGGEPIADPVDGSESLGRWGCSPMSLLRC